MRYVWRAYWRRVVPLVPFGRRVSCTHLVRVRVRVRVTVRVRVRARLRVRVRANPNPNAPGRDGDHH